MPAVGKTKKDLLKQQDMECRKITGGQ